LHAADPAVIEKLSGKGKFTVFAPTDAAFVSLLDELGLTAEQLLSNKALVIRVLLYHVARGNRDSEDVLESKRIRTLRGFLFQDNGVLTDANGRTANIIAVDIKASNGIIHVIDRVVLPNLNPESDDDNDNDDDDDRPRCSGKIDTYVNSVLERLDFGLRNTPRHNLLGCIYFLRHADRHPFATLAPRRTPAPGAL